MTHFDAKTLVNLREQLELERTSLMSELAVHGEQHDGVWNARSEESGEEADATDVADNIEELITNVPIVSDLEMRLRDVDEAMKKMDEGSYGVCEKEGEPIVLERLKVNPAARTCVAHAK